MPGYSGLNMRALNLRLTIPPLIALLTYCLCSALPAAQQMVAIVFAVTVSFWILELLPFWIPALFAPLILILMGILPVTTPFEVVKDEVILLLIGTFLIGRAVQVCGLDRRIALCVLSSAWLVRTPQRLLLSLGALACTMSLFLSNTAVTAMLLPIGVKIVHTLKLPAGHPVVVATMLMLTWGSSVAVGFVVGTPANLIAHTQILRQTGVNISFFSWMLFAMPITIVLLFLAWRILLYLYPPANFSTENTVCVAQEELASLKQTTSAQRRIAILLSIVLVLWSLPELVSGTLKDWGIYNLFTPSKTALLAAIITLLLPAGGPVAGRLLPLRDALKIDWSILGLFAGGIALGDAAYRSGLAASVGGALVSLAPQHDLFILTALLTFSAIILSELASNTLSATLLVPLAISIAQASSLNPIPPSLGVALGASLGFMMPVSTPPNSIVYSSGLVSARDMMRSGILLDIFGFIVVMISLRTILPLLGWW